MRDDTFYNQHLESPFGLKTMIVRMRYTIKKDEFGHESIEKREVIAVYKYNQTSRIPLPVGENIVSAPFRIQQSTEPTILPTNQQDQPEQGDLLAELDKD